MENDDRLAIINKLKISIDNEIKQRCEPRKIIEHM